MVDIRMISQLGKDLILEYDENRDEIFIKDTNETEDILYRAKTEDFKKRFNIFWNEVNILKNRYNVTTKKKSFFNT
jgi:hypothetical protein